MCGILGNKAILTELMFGLSCIGMLCTLYLTGTGNGPQLKVNRVLVTVWLQECIQLVY